MKTTSNNSYIKFNVQLPNGKIVEITLPLVTVIITQVPA
jgi:hypothetical protein